METIRGWSLTLMLYIENISDTIPDFLKDHNFIVPKICLYEDENLEIIFSKSRMPTEFTMYSITEKYGKDRIMWYYPDHSLGYCYYAEYELAYGHVLITGLGMNMVPNWIATKPEVTKVTVVENNEHLINYIKTYGYIDDKVEIIHGDANYHTGKYDTFFLDHNYGNGYPGEKNALYINKILNNISCDLLWNQRIIKMSDNDFDTYLNLRKYVPKLPDINKEKFELYKRLYYHGYY
jgi:hypothetical protein